MELFLSRINALAVSAIKYVRDRLVPRSINWAKGMESWECPTDPSTSQGGCLCISWE